MISRIPLLFLTLTFAVGCASTQPHATGNPVQGPGTLFSTIQEAAVDGLAWSMRDARRDAHTPRLRIGVVRKVEGGYTYDEPGVAPRSRPTRLEYKLGQDAVAHFQHYPTRERGHSARVFESHTAYQRSVVDEIDPLHRPSFLLTPSLRVVEYRGGTTEPVVARLNRPDWRRRTSAFAAR